MLVQPRDPNAAIIPEYQESPAIAAMTIPFIFASIIVFTFPEGFTLRCNLEHLLYDLSTGAGVKKCDFKLSCG